MTERRYGDDKTLHRTGYLDVEVDAAGRVVAVWFRCQPVPFVEHRVPDSRARDMRAMYADGPRERLVAVVLDG